MSGAQDIFHDFETRFHLGVKVKHQPETGLSAVGERMQFLRMVIIIFNALGNFIHVAVDDNDVLAIAKGHVLIQIIRCHHRHTAHSSLDAAAGGKAIKRAGMQDE